MSNTAERTFTLRALDDLGLRHIRISENWRRRPLHPAPEDFAPLKRRLSALRAGGLKVLLTIENDGPDAACGARHAHGCYLRADAPLEGFITALLAAVGDDIEAIQFSNEWDGPYRARADEFLALHARAARTIRATRPGLPLVMGGITGNAPYAVSLCTAGATPTRAGGVSWAQAVAKFCARTDEIAARCALVDHVLRRADFDVLDLHLYDAEALWPAALDWAAPYAKSRPI